MCLIAVFRCHYAPFLVIEPLCHLTFYTAASLWLQAMNWILDKRLVSTNQFISSTVCLQSTECVDVHQKWCNIVQHVQKETLLPFLEEFECICCQCPTLSDSAGATILAVGIL